MQNPYVADFYHGWIIEIIRKKEGFSSTGYSPARESFSDYTVYPSDFQALNAAKKVIDQYVVRHKLARFLREMYELNELTFEEWQALHQSLMQAIAAS